MNAPPITAVRRAVETALVEELEPLGDLSAALVPAGTTATLNFLDRMSGIATLTAQNVALVGGRCLVLDTRKTTPGLRALEKSAVRAGGGHNHRGNLSEMVMLKDNHLAGLAIADAVVLARRRWPHAQVEVECDRHDQVVAAVDAGADAVLLDNMAPAQIAACVAHVRSVSAGPRRCRIEVSGGVTLDTVDSLGAAGPDLISIGALTHSAPVLDIGLDLSVSEVEHREGSS